MNSTAPYPAPKFEDSTLEEDERLPTDDETDDIHAKLRRIHMDEVVGLSQDSSNRQTVNTLNNYKAFILLETGRLIRFIVETWNRTIVTALWGGLRPFDWFSVMFFAIGQTILLPGVLIFSLALHFPTLVRIYYYLAHKYGGGLGVVNSGSPNLFHAIRMDQVGAAKESMSRPIGENLNNEDNRYFDYDIAKLMLQIVSVMYEHENDAIRKAVRLIANTQPTSYVPIIGGAVKGVASNVVHQKVVPGGLLAVVFSLHTVDGVAENLDSRQDRLIRDWGAKFGIHFEVISELNNIGSACAGLFWDPRSNWIVVACKGTTPTEFGEWLSEFNAGLTDCDGHISGFSRGHKGSKERVFPSKVSELGYISPYDSIALGVKTLAKHLRKTNGMPGETRINVWVTGHSLGCATASLIYSRFLMNLEDMGKNTDLRDAYLFAAPIVCDQESVRVFNQRMFEDPKRPKTMWRITSHGDAVATSLPELGDNASLRVSPNNHLAFAHLGTEIKLRDDPLKCQVAGNHVFCGANVYITSRFTKEQIAAHRADRFVQPGEARRERIGILLQNIPIIGRLIAHCAIYYWDQLDRIALEQCEWVVN